MYGMLLLALCTLFSALASVGLKLASQRIDTEFSVLGLLSNVYVWLGGLAYFLTFIGYIYALRTIPLSLVQPTITAGASVLTALFAFWYFRESMSAVNWLGLCLVCVGIVMLFLGRA